MSDLRQALFGILAALFCTFLVLGSLALALAENRQPIAQAPTSTQTSAPINTPLPGQPTFTPSPTSMPALTPAPIITSTCAQPPGWQRYDILPGDTLASLAQAFNTTVEELQRNNCDVNNAMLNPGLFIFVPLPQPSETPTLTATIIPTEASKPRKPNPTKNVVACSGHPSGWVIYIIRTGDTLYSIGRATGATVAQLMAANCMTSDHIHTGDLLYVPHLPPIKTPVPTRTPVRTATPTTRPPTATPTRQPSNTPAPTPTATPLPTLPPTDTRVPPHTRVPSDTPVPPSDTPIPSDTPVPNPT
jgi:LysM repeat protein